MATLPERPAFEPYYSDELVTLYHGRCEDVLPTLNLSGPVHLLTDPPYFKVKDEDWDNQWSKSADFLDWMGEWLDLAKPHLSADASVWVFASPELTSAVESVVAQRFRVLNSIRWVKPQGWHMKTELAASRTFLSPWEGILFAEQATDDPDVVAAPIGAYLRAERERAGVSRSEIQALFLSANGKMTGALSNWEIGYNMPTRDQYEAIRKRLGGGALDRDYEFLRREYEDLRAEFEDTRRPFNLNHRDRSTDVFTFDTVAPYPGKHACEKPVGLLTHMIETTTRPGDTIIDCFAGSGAVLDVARQLGRKAVGIEMDEHWCHEATKRLSQQAFDLGVIA